VFGQKGRLSTVIEESKDPNVGASDRWLRGGQFRLPGPAGAGVPRATVNALSRATASFLGRGAGYSVSLASPNDAYS